MVFVEASRLTSIASSALPPQGELPSPVVVVDILTYFVIELDKAQLAGHVGTVIVDRSPVQERMLAAIPSLDELLGEK